MCHSDRFFTEYFGFPMLISFHKYPTLIGSSIIDTVWWSFEITHTKVPEFSVSYDNKAIPSSPSPKSVFVRYIVVINSSCGTEWIDTIYTEGRCRTRSSVSSIHLPSPQAIFLRFILQINNTLVAEPEISTPLASRRRYCCSSLLECNKQDGAAHVPRVSCLIFWQLA